MWFCSIEVIRIIHRIRTGKSVEPLSLEKCLSQGVVAVSVNFTPKGITAQLSDGLTLGRLHANVIDYKYNYFGIS